MGPRELERFLVRGGDGERGAGTLEVFVGGGARRQPALSAPVAASTFGGPPPCGSVLLALPAPQAGPQANRQLCFPPAATESLLLDATGRGSAQHPGPGPRGAFLIAERGGCSYADKAVAGGDAGVAGVLVLQHERGAAGLVRMPADPELFRDQALLARAAAAMAPHSLLGDLRTMARKHRRG